MDYQITVKNLSFGYQDSKVLQGISIELPKKGITSIVGPNGSGKSTLLKLISGVLKPDEGGVYLNNQNSAKINHKDIAKILSVVPQNTALEFDYKVMDIVLMGRYSYIKRLRGETPRDREIAEEYMKYTNTYHLKDRSFNQLSGGERQRVILAQALTQQPKILLLDEPISHLDLQHQIEMMNLIKKLAMDQDLAVIAVLHDLNIAAAYSDYIYMLKSGEIAAEGTPAEAFTVENIRNVFNIDVDVEVSALTNKPYIYAIKRHAIKKNGKRVHVICGGGSGNELISGLVNAGYDVSAGVLSIGDLDWKISKDADLEVAEEIPFTRISDEAYETNKRLAKAADYILLTDFYMGKANLRNLELLLEKELEDKPLLILGDDAFEERDYTDGIAASLYRQIMNKPATQKVLKDELFSILSKAGEGNE